MGDQMADIFGAIIGILIIIAVLSGAIKTFRRNWIAALLLLIFLFPIWVVWAIVEVFTGEINKQPGQPTTNNQNMTINLVNQTDGTTTRLVSSDFSKTPEIIDARVVDEAIVPPLPAAEAIVDTKECPYCAETIKQNAIVCRYCNRDL